MKPAVEMQKVLRWTEGRSPVSGKDALAAEEPLEIQIDTRPVCVTMRTPGHDVELAAGFLFTEGLVKLPEDIERIAPYGRNGAGNVIQVFLAPEVGINHARLQRNVFVSSSCGLCGKASIEAVHQHFPPIQGRAFTVANETLIGLIQTLHRSQDTFAQTGGLHAAALFSSQGELLVIREDIGRHNAVDKVLGQAFLAGGMPLSQSILLVSGRASFEILQKALAAQIPIVAAISAPSSLAVHFAQASGQTLVGFLRPARMNLYSRPERVRFSGVPKNVLPASRRQVKTKLSVNGKRLKQRS